MVLAAMLLVFTAWFRETTIGDAVAEVPALVGELGRAARRGWRIVSPDRSIEWQELERRGARLLRREVKPSIAGTRIVPSVCTLAMSPKDFDGTLACHDFVARSLQTWLANQAKRRGWQLPGGIPLVRFAADPAVLDGEVLCSTAWSDARPASAAPPPPASAPLEPTRLAETVAVLSAAPSPSPALRLVGEGVDVNLDCGAASIEIGRSRRCVVRVDDPKVSAEHATLRRSATGWELVDVSRNGTWLDDRRVTEPTPIGDASRIRIGDSTLGIVRDSA